MIIAELVCKIMTQDHEVLQTKKMGQFMKEIQKIKKEIKRKYPRKSKPRKPKFTFEPSKRINIWEAIFMEKKFRKLLRS